MAEFSFLLPNDIFLTVSNEKDCIKFKQKGWIKREEWRETYNHKNSLKVNVPFVRFKEYWDDLKARGLISAESGISLTKEGERYLEEYHKVRQFLEEFGFIKEEEDDTENDR
jgi:predicted transcriptional regulator